MVKNLSKTQQNLPILKVATSYDATMHKVNSKKITKELFPVEILTGVGGKF